MQKEKLLIEFPSDDEIQLQIQKIIEKGVKPKDSYLLFLKKMYQQIGFRHLFRDLSEIIFMISLVSAVLVFGGLYINHNYQEEIGLIYSFVFIVSPILYLVISLFFYENAKYKDTYEVEMTCKYNIYQIASFRMLVFSIACMGINGVLIYFLTILNQNINFFFAYLVSITSLFLFSTAFLYIDTKIGTVYLKYMFLSGWIILNIILEGYSADFYRSFISDIPIYAYIGITVVCMWIYIKKLKNLITITGSERMI